MPLTDRQLEPELMDDPDIDAGSHDHALEGLARLNRISNASMPFREELLRILRQPTAMGTGAPLTVLDLATGSGDLVVELERWRRGLPDAPPVRWLACDRSTHALERARDRAAGIDLDLQTFRCDATTDALPDCDVVLCSLFLHHLESETATDVLRRMARTARFGGIVTDLKRSSVGLSLAWLMPRLFTRSRVVHADAVGSVRAAFSTEEFARIVSDAGIPNPFIFHSFPERQGVRWRRDPLPENAS